VRSDGNRGVAARVDDRATRSGRIGNVCRAADMGLMFRAESAGQDGIDREETGYREHDSGEEKPVGARFTGL
jgi:hypothetical protein